MTEPRNRALQDPRGARVGRSSWWATVGAVLVAGLLSTPAGSAAAPRGEPTGGQQQQDGRQEEQTAQQVPQTVDLHGGGYIDRVLLRVNGEPILQSDLDEQWEYVRPGLQGLPEEQLEAQEEELRKAVLAQMADNLLLMQRADEMGISASTNQIDRALSNVMQRMGLSTEEELEQALAAEGLTLGEMRDQLAEQIVQQAITYQEIQQQLFVSESQLRRYYDENIDQFTEPAQVMFQQAVFVTEEDSSANVRQQAQQALDDLRGGASLASIAEEYPSAQVPPSSDWLALGDLRPEIAETVQGLPIGDYSEPVETPFGFHIVQVINRKERRVQPFEEVSQEVRQILLRQQEEEATAEYTARLRETAHIEVMAPEYQSLAEDWEDGGAASVAGRSR